ncbi:MAG: flagellar basal body L-ring protein FlgH [Planctomycetota bacterium]
MKRGTFLTAVGMTAALAVAGGAPAGEATKTKSSSLWLKAEADGKVKESRGLFEETKPRLHGLVTVLIEEESKADNEAKTDLERKSGMDVKFNSFANVKAHGIGDMKLNPTASIKPELDVEAKKDFNGKGSTERKNTVKARITAEVVQVMPNGNLVIEGKKKTKVNDEEEDLVLTGTVRPEDILPDNSVSSTKVADLRIRYEGKGPLATTQRRGWLHKFVDAVWPF